MFIRCTKGMNPATLVHGICMEAETSGHKMGGRYIKRMTPISASADASLSGLDLVLEKVLPDSFGISRREINQMSQSLAEKLPIRYKIAVTIRNHNTLTRDQVIEATAANIRRYGDHVVDLKNYEVLVMIECFRGFLGASCVKDWERFRKYNLSEIIVKEAS